MAIPEDELDELEDELDEELEEVLEEELDEELDEEVEEDEEDELDEELEELLELEVPAPPQPAKVTEANNSSAPKMGGFFRLNFL